MMPPPTDAEVLSRIVVPPWSGPGERPGRMPAPRFRLALRYGESRRPATLLKPPDIGELESEERLGPARRHDELDFEAVRWVDLDDGTHVSGLEAMSRDVTDQRNGIEQLEGHGFLRQGAQATCL